MEQCTFIFEVKSKPCLWNPFVASYLDRSKKRQAWEEIAAKMYQEFDSCSNNEKAEKVRELRKKWKCLTDYYYRRDPKKDIDTTTKQKKPIVVLLQFLNIVTTFHNQPRTQESIDKKIKLSDYKLNVQKFNADHVEPYTSEKMTFLSPEQSLDHGLQLNQIKFLLSLLPIMQNLNDRQRFEFKLRVMILIKKIKYEE